MYIISKGTAFFTNIKTLWQNYWYIHKKSSSTTWGTHVSVRIATWPWQNKY